MHLNLDQSREEGEWVDQRTLGRDPKVEAVTLLTLMSSFCINCFVLESINCLSMEKTV